MHWPKDKPMFALIGNNGHSKWSRWSIIGHADGERYTCRDADALSQLGKILKKQATDTLLPNWIGFLSYELGYAIEPSSGSIPDCTWPLFDLVWCDRALLHDANTNTWWSIGGCEVPAIAQAPHSKPAWQELQDSAGETAFANAVQKTISYIHAGDIFQANVTRRFSTNVSGDIRTSALSLLGSPGGWYGAWLEFPSDGRYVMSMSPELFLQFNKNTREIVTRPMKGTRPEQDDPAVLMNSTKDAAELHMIVDLMRNDLGRICEFGSVHVEAARTIERHPTVWQCVGEVHGKVLKSCTIEDVLRATFPPGSVTGAPKIRAMQIIQELEATPRGPYCGAIGILGNITPAQCCNSHSTFQWYRKP